MTARKALSVKKIKQEETSESSESESAPEEQCIDSDSCSENNDYYSDDRPSDDDLYINGGMTKMAILDQPCQRKPKKLKKEEEIGTRKSGPESIDGV